MSRTLLKLISLLLVVVLPTSSYAFEGIRWGSSAWDHARILPVGKTSLEVRGQRSESQSASTDSAGFGSNGLQRLSYKQSLGEVLRQTGANESLLSTAQSNGVDLDQIISEAFLNIERDYSETQIRWAHSLTPHWMLGFSIPVVNATTRVSVETEDLSNQLEGDVALLNRAARGKLTTQKFGELIEDMGWDSLEDELTYTGLGNVELLSQVQVWQERSWLLAVRNRFMLPAAGNGRAYQPIPVGPESSSMSLGADALLDWQPMRSFLLTGVLGYTTSLRDEVEARVPNQNDSRWFWGVDPNVTRDLGDHILGRINSSARIWSSVWMTAGYEYFRKYSDYFEGTVFDRESYRRLEEGSAFTRETGRLGLRYQPLKLSVNQTGLVYAAGLEYLTVFASRENPRIDGTSLDLQVFF
ncbi:MAG: hypothetical protein HRT45_09220 [Bdellovibrionales bacterium]|nr:hypothetical protein [Bdellovibrionales bacterium]